MNLECAACRDRAVSRRPVGCLSSAKQDMRPVCRTCVRLHLFKWESAVDEMRRIERAERDTAKQLRR